jgi:hypothetical protein
MFGDAVAAAAWRRIALMIWVRLSFWPWANLHPILPMSGY